VTNDLVLVTGAGGNVGREVVRQLAARGVPYRAAVVNDADAARVPDLGGEHVVFDFTDPTTFGPAFDGVTKLFLMRPPQISNIERDMKPAIDYAVSAGVQHIVFLSLVGAEKLRIVPHAKVEELVVASGVPYTFLRCAFFMQNLDTTHRQDLVEHSDIFIPAGKGKTSFIDVRDIGEAAAITLTEPGHENTAIPLTGAEALSYDEVAAMMTEVLGRPITYSDPAPLKFARRFRQRGYDASYINVMEGIYLTTRFGMAAIMTPDAVELLGRPTISMRQYIEDYASVWAPQEALSTGPL
jgi:uncharacterized protein YbjT (DUF2867 family)